MRGLKWIAFGVAGLTALVLLVFLGGHVIRLLWNWLTPTLFGWPEITFWQALGLLALCRILFGGFSSHKGGGHGEPRFRARMADRMADRVARRLEVMTPEERERFRQRLRERCGFDPAPGGGVP